MRDIYLFIYLRRMTSRLMATIIFHVQMSALVLEHQNEHAHIKPQCNIIYWEAIARRWENDCRVERSHENLNNFICTKGRLQPKNQKAKKTK